MIDIERTLKAAEERELQEAAKLKECPPIRSSESIEAGMSKDEAMVTLVEIPDSEHTVLQGTVAEARQLLETNMRFFLMQCYPELSREIPDFHCEMLETMLDRQIQNLVCICPRGFAKTMIARATVVMEQLTGNAPFAVVINKTIADAQNSTRVIWRIINSQFFQQIYGKVEPVIERDGIGEYQYVQNGQYKVLYARGRDSALQGLNVQNMRPNLILLDDIEQAKDGDKDTTYEETKHWFFETMLFLMDAVNKRVIYIGNMNRKNSVMVDLLSMSDWHSIVLSAIKSDGTSLWEDRFPLKSLLAEFKQYCEAGLRSSWLAQKMSRVDEDNIGLLDVRDIEFHAGLYPDDIEYGCITIDPAISDSARADESVICVHGWHNGAWNLCEIVHEVGMDAMRLIRRAIRLATKWKLRLVCIEAIAYQKALIPLMKAELDKNGLDRQILVRPISSRSSKAVRIDAWFSMLRNHFYRLGRLQLDVLEQIQVYQVASKSTHDDRIDCCAMISMAAQSYRHLMRKSLQDPLLRMLEESRLDVRTGYDTALQDSKTKWDEQFSYGPFKNIT